MVRIAATKWISGRAYEHLACGEKRFRTARRNSGLDIGAKELSVSSDFLLTSSEGAILREALSSQRIFDRLQLAGIKVIEIYHDDGDPFVSSSVFASCDGEFNQTGKLTVSVPRIVLSDISRMADFLSFTGMNFEDFGFVSDRL